jgi:hypothetical protein
MPLIRRQALGVALILLLLASCGPGTPTPAPSPSAKTSQAPGNAVVESLVDGSAHVALTGDVGQSYDFDFVAATNEEDMSILAWNRGINSFDLLAAPDALTPGSHRTSRTLWITLVLQSIDASFVSDQGECTIRLELPGANALKGRVTCHRLTSERRNKTVSLVATFSAGPRGA